VIKSFSDKTTVGIWKGDFLRRLPEALALKAVEKLQLLDAATRLEDLFFPPSNGFHRLVGNRAGWYSIKVNNKWRLIFTWTEGGPAIVALVDYH